MGGKPTATFIRSHNYDGKFLFFIIRILERKKEEEEKK
jgi:hypothetical protein